MYEDYSANPHFEYLLRLADTTLILGHRLSEWTGHGPILEQDIAITNIALDLVGQSRMYYKYAAEVEGASRTEDDLAYYRDHVNFRNPFLVEQPNGHWGHTIVRQVIFDQFHFLFLRHILQDSSDNTLKSIAQKAIKEVKYHLSYSSEWLVRLGDGTEESQSKMQEATNQLWRYSGELVTPDALDDTMLRLGIGVDLSQIAPTFWERLDRTFAEATLSLPENEYMQLGGKRGTHSEHLSYVLAEMQSVPRAMPGLQW